MATNNGFTNATDWEYELFPTYVEPIEENSPPEGYFDYQESTFTAGLLDPNWDSINPYSNWTGNPAIFPEPLPPLSPLTKQTHRPAVLPEKKRRKKNNKTASFEIWDETQGVPDARMCKETCVVDYMKLHEEWKGNDPVVCYCDHCVEMIRYHAWIRGCVCRQVRDVAGNVKAAKRSTSNDVEPWLQELRQRWRDQNRAWKRDGMVSVSLGWQRTIDDWWEIWQMWRSVCSRGRLSALEESNMRWERSKGLDRMKVVAAIREIARTAREEAWEKRQVEAVQRGVARLSIK